MKSYRYEPLGASSYIPTPPSKAHKYSLINVQNKDDHRCFEFSVVAALHPVEDHRDHPYRTSNYEPFMGKLKCVKAPMTIDDIPKFESANNINISVYTMKHDGDIVYPLYMTKRRNDDPIINLLMITKEDNNSHYTLIKDLNAFLRKPNDHHTKVFCPYCCYGYCTERNGQTNLAEHRLRCRPHGAQRTKYLPEGENIIQFKEFEKMQKVPFCIYADFETLNVKAEDTEDVFEYDENWDPLDSGCEIKTNHQESGFTFYNVSDYFENKKVTYRGLDAGEVFLNRIHEEKKRIMDILQNIEPKNLSKKEKASFKEATTCHICSNPFLGEIDDKGHKVIITSSKSYI